jgi:hypothetical protein
MTGTSGRAVASPIDPVAAAKATAAQAGAKADALQRQFQTRKTASDLAIFRKADSQSMAGIKPPASMSKVRPMGPQGRGSARPVSKVSSSPDKQTGAGGDYSQAGTKQAAAQRVVGSAFDALAANDRGSNMTTSAASLEAQKLAKKLATKKLEAQKNEIIKVPANSYQPETRAAQSSRIDNLKREMAKRSEERKKRTDLQTAADAVADKK